MYIVVWLYWKQSSPINYKSIPFFESFLSPSPSIMTFSLILSWWKIDIEKLLWNKLKKINIVKS